jgi:molybdopterin-binding protein
VSGQHETFSANCTTRGSPAAVIVPNAADPTTVLGARGGGVLVGHLGPRLGALVPPRGTRRTAFHGFIDEVRVDGLLAEVRLRVGDQSLTAVITADAVRSLHLRRGDDALAVIKSTEVMIARSLPLKNTGARSDRRRRR